MFSGIASSLALYGLGAGFILFLFWRVISAIKKQDRLRQAVTTLENNLTAYKKQKKANEIANEKVSKEQTIKRLKDGKF